MHILSNYKLEFRYEKRKNLFSIMNYLSAFFRALAIIFILPSILVSVYFVIGIGISIMVSFLIDYIAKKNLFTLICECMNGYLVVKRVSIDGKEKNIHNIEMSNIESLEIVKKTGNTVNDDETIDYTKNLNNNQFIIVKIAYNNFILYLPSDEYMYALIDSTMEKKYDLS